MAAMAQIEPDILITDIAMPDEDGFELIRRVRESALGRDIPVVALTAFSSEPERRRILAAGFQAHLNKPVKVELLSAVLVDLHSQARHSG